MYLGIPDMNPLQNIRQEQKMCIRDRVCADPSFGLDYDEVEALLKPEAFTGRAPQQVEEYLTTVVQPILEANRDLLGDKAEINV